jgi:3-methyladenine DNA glycosylase AlkD
MQNSICVTQGIIQTYQPTIDLEETIRKIKELLRLRMNGATSVAMRKSGLNYQLNFGLDAMSIREIATRFEPNMDLAEYLWSENARECKILATLLYPRTDFTPEKANEWLKDCFLPELTEQLCFNLLQHLPFAPQKAMEWIKSLDTETKCAGYILLLRLLLKKAPVSELDSALALGKEDLRSDDYRLQITAKRFLERATSV